ncbi:alpha/beta hydrolase [Actinotalea ferrariae]|uniref:alpha/beta fold hydrolase n=1 Tax=Actinotalea ferrariae TaxID=1386098 RepID=UPI001C8C024D|nr:alpha/beta hydrolase [Actinotalea ferrariae]MBX9245235.1 alpha/beta hydrolase [Actinotalea ferrariae]
MLEGFELATAAVGDVVVRYRTGGVGEPVVLLHGHPRTHTTWHRVAPLLATRWTVVCPDLRGYGGSSAPPSDDEHRPYSKRAMAGDVVALMDLLGHERFAVVGHDRGAYVAHRLAADHPDRVTRLAVLDAVPIGAALLRADARFAQLWWHWFWLGQTVRPAEDVILRDPAGWYALQADPALMGAENHADLMAAVADPATVHAMCEDYRAGLGVDRAADDADRASGRRLRCPVLVLWSTLDDMATLYGDPRQVWREWADDVSGAPVTSGHHMAEEAPDELAAALTAFLAR